MTSFHADPRIDDRTRLLLRGFCETLGEDILRLARDLGLKVFEEDLLPYESGFLEYAPTCGSASNFRIVVNRHQSIERRRFSVAHEIAHFVLHRDKSDFAFRSETRHRTNKDLDPFVYLDQCDKHLEAEANKFASALLMPPNLFRPANIRLEGDVDRLAKLFGVSREVARRRLSELPPF